MAVTSPLAPADRYTRHRWHWVRKNDFEVWEWMRGGRWARPGQIHWIGEREAAALGWEYVGEAHAPAAPTSYDEAKD